jgi:hypothetical protein
MGAGVGAGVVAGVAAGVAAGDGDAAAAGVGVATGVAAGVGLGFGVGTGVGFCDGVVGATCAGVGVGTSAVIGLDGAGEGDGVGVGAGVGVALAIGPGGGSVGVGDSAAVGAVRVGTFATGAGAVGRLSGGWLTVPTPNATPTRTRLTIPKATTRRARWAAVTTMGALLSRGCCPSPFDRIVPSEPPDQPFREWSEGQPSGATSIGS